MKDIEEKVMTQEEKAKAYDEAIKRAKAIYYQGSYKPDTAATIAETLRSVFPELAESNDEKIRKELIDFVKSRLAGFPQCEKFIAWLEKQVPVDEDEIVKGIRRGVAISLMNHIDANSKGMCLSNMECEDIENAIVNEDWDKVYGYMKKKLEKQGEQKPTDKVEPTDYNSIDPHFSKPIDKVEPMFNIGDTIVEKDLDECGYGTIKDIKDGQYIFTDGSGMNINEQNGWQLVKTSTNIKQKPAWSEEDDDAIGQAIVALEDMFDEDNPQTCYAGYKLSFIDAAERLKSLKDRINWKPSEEQLNNK